MAVLAERVLYSIPEAMALLGLSRTVTQGRRRYVAAHALFDYVKLLEQEAPTRGGAA